MGRVRPGRNIDLDSAGADRVAGDHAGRAGAQPLAVVARYTPPYHPARDGWCDLHLQPTDERTLDRFGRAPPMWTGRETGPIEDRPRREL
jgi:hypothetical protein